MVMFEVVSDEELGVRLGLQNEAKYDGVVDPPAKRMHEMEEENRPRRKMEWREYRKQQQIARHEQNKLVRCPVRNSKSELIIKAHIKYSPE